MFGMHIVLEYIEDDALSVDAKIKRAIGPFKTGDDAWDFVRAKANGETFLIAIPLEAVPS